MKCAAITHLDYRGEKCSTRCNRPATWHAPAGAQVAEMWLCDEHRAEFIEACSRWCHPAGWKWPEQILSQEAVAELRALGLEFCEPEAITPPSAGAPHGAGK